MSVSEGSLSPEFSSEIQEYIVNVRNEVKSKKVTGEKEDSLSQVKGNGTYKLTSGENKITITVISETGKEKEYIVKVKREYNTDNSLKSLSVKEGNIEFSREKIEYEIEVEYEIDKVKTRIFI